MKKLITIFVATGLLFVVQLVQAGSPPVVLEGNYLRVGVSNSGGLIDDSFTVGIDYDKTGTASWTGGDFLKPGTPFEFYSVGYNDPGTWAHAGYWSGNPFAMATTNTSSGTTNSASSGPGDYGPLRIQQELAFDDSDSEIEFHVTLTNTNTLDPLHDVVYARGLDPDQDSSAGGGTINNISGDFVTAYGPLTDWRIGIHSDLPGSILSIRQDWSQNPYSLLTPENDGNGDYTINMAWMIGTLGPGQSVDFYYQYVIGTGTGSQPVIPAPGAIVLVSIGVTFVGWLRRRRTL